MGRSRLLAEAEETGKRGRLDLHGFSICTATRLQSVCGESVERVRQSTLGAKHATSSRDRVAHNEWQTQGGTTIAFAENQVDSKRVLTLVLLSNALQRTANKLANAEQERRGD